MSYTVSIFWEKERGQAFADKKYSRSHTWEFDCGLKLTASSSPHVVPLPMSNEAAVDPEEAFVASISSCHMLWFLAIAAERNFIVESYRDDAEGRLGKTEEGRMAMTQITLNPTINFTQERNPSQAEIKEMHDLAHERCFIANSVKTKITVSGADSAQ